MSPILIKEETGVQFHIRFYNWNCENLIEAGHLLQCPHFANEEAVAQGITGLAKVSTSSEQSCK